MRTDEDPVQPRAILREQLPQPLVNRLQFVLRDEAPQDKLEAIHQRLRELLSKDGAWLDGIFICPHHPDEGCNCRKPAPGLVHRALQELGVFPGNAIVIGDKATDVELARNVGALAVFVRSGNAPEEEQARIAARGLAPDYVARDLTEAVRWVLRTVNTQETLIVKRHTLIWGSLNGNR